MSALIADKLKFRGAILLLSFVPLLHPSITFGQNMLAAPPPERLYDCYGSFVDEDTYAALTQLAALNQPIVDDLFGVGASCGGVFSLDWAPFLVDVETPSGEIVRIPELETIPGKYVYGEGATEPFECEIFGYWESDFTQEPWTDELTPEQLDQLLAVNGAIGLIWAKLLTARGAVYVSWQVIQFDTGVDDPARAVILLADGTRETGSTIAEFRNWQSILRGWLGDGVGDPPPGGDPPDDPWDNPPVWDVPPGGVTIGPPPGPPGYDDAVPEVACENNPEYQYCLDIAKTAYYDCLKKAYEDLEGCMAGAAATLVLVLAGCVFLGATAPFLWFLVWAVCAAIATDAYNNSVRSCKTVYSLRKAICRNTYYISKLACCTQYE